MIKEAIAKLVERTDLSRKECETVMGEIMEGRASAAQISAFLIALRMKGETPDEIAGCAKAMRAKATTVRLGPGPAVDTCGTGGDVKGTFNISTAAALVAAGAGVTVAKHGNRSFTGKTGSADVMAALGVDIEADACMVEKCLAEAKIAFLFAPNFHRAMKHAVGPRREIGVRTIFNILGPLANPAGVSHQVIGVFDPALTETLARALRNLNAAHCLVVHGGDGLDEITIAGHTQISELVKGEVKTYDVTPEDIGVKQGRIEQLRVGSPEESAEVIKRVLSGRPGPQREIVLANAAAALYAADAAKDLKEGVVMAARSIDDGGAMAALKKLIEISPA